MPIRTAKQPVIWFTDRPARDAGTLSMGNFVGLWSVPGTNTFATDPPNVAIDYTSGGTQKTFIATMTSPVIIPPTATPGTAKLQATMTAVPEAQLATYAKGKGKLAKHAKEARLNALRFPASSVGVSAPALFVDNWGWSNTLQTICVSAGGEYYSYTTPPNCAINTTSGGAWPTTVQGVCDIAYPGNWYFGTMCFVGTIYPAGWQF